MNEHAVEVKSDRDNPLIHRFSVADRLYWCLNWLLVLGTSIYFVSATMGARFVCGIVGVSMASFFIGWNLHAAGVTHVQDEIDAENEEC